LGMGLDVHHHWLLLRLGKLLVGLVANWNLLLTRHGLSKLEILILVALERHWDGILALGMTSQVGGAGRIRDYSLMWILDSFNLDITYSV